MRDLVVILSGNSPRNAEWGQQLEHKFSKFSDSYFHKYNHWQTGVSDIDFAQELKELTAYLKTYDGKYFILAKSAGGLLAFEGVSAGLLHPSSIVCVGLPLTYARYRNISIQDLVNRNVVPTLYIQAQYDPMGSGTDVQAITKEYGEFKSIAGETHDYSDLALIVKESLKFFSNQSL